MNLLSLLVALWLSTGFLTFHVVPHPSEGQNSVPDLAKLVMFFWVALVVVFLLGPVGLYCALEFREERRRELSKGKAS